MSVVYRTLEVWLPFSLCVNRSKILAQVNISLKITCACVQINANQDTWWCYCIQLRKGFTKFIYLYWNELLRNRVRNLGDFSPPPQFAYTLAWTHRVFAHSELCHICMSLHVSLCPWTHYSLQNSGMSAVCWCHLQSPCLLCTTVRPVLPAKWTLIRYVRLTMPHRSQEEVWVPLSTFFRLCCQ